MSVVVIPKSAVLSTRSCTLADHIPHAPYGHDATLTLSLALYSEQCVLLRETDRALLSRVPTPMSAQATALSFSMGRVPAVAPERSKLAWNCSFMGRRLA